MSNMLPGSQKQSFILADDEREAAEFIARIDDLMDEWSDSRGEPRYGWAADTLDGIKETVIKTRRVSENQKRAVDHIEESRRR